MGLKRELRKQNLPIPKQLKGAENERFVRKNYSNDVDNDYMTRQQHSPNPAKHQSSRSRVNMNYLSTNEQDNILQYVPEKSIINKDIEVLEWQRTAL